MVTGLNIQARFISFLPNYFYFKLEKIIFLQIQTKTRTPQLTLKFLVILEVFPSPYKSIDKTSSD